MSLHVFANIVTPYGTAANNRGDNQGGNVTPLQKLIWFGQPHTTVSAEAIRFAFRRCLKGLGLDCNRNWAEHPAEIPPAVFEQLQKAFKGAVNTPCGYFIDPDFAWYHDPNAAGFADDDLLGFMSAEAGREEADAIGGGEPTGGVGEEDVDSTAHQPKRRRKKLRGTTYVRRAVLEVSRAVSLTPWAGDVTFNAASPGATPSAQKKGSYAVPYGTELHATRYQYGIALTPERLRKKSRAAEAVRALCELGTVAGNHGRFLFDFSPDSVVFRICQDPAPRFLYCFETTDDGRTVDAPELLRRVEQNDIKGEELIIGGPFTQSEAGKKLKALGAFVHDTSGIEAARGEVIRRVNQLL